jgi:hypothetical protein
LDRPRLGHSNYPLGALAIFAAAWHLWRVWAAVVAAILFAAPAGEVTLRDGVTGIDAQAVQEGLRARVGEAAAEWAIEIGQVGEQAYRVDLIGPDGQVLQREVSLEGATSEDRSRELASTIALIIQAADEEPVREGPAPEEPVREGPEPERDRPRGLLLVEGHVGLGPPRDLDQDFGLGLAGGAWLVREHLQPRAAVRWSHSRAGDLRMHQVSARLGVAAGAPVGAFWLGVLAMPAIEWTHASQIGTASTWSGGGEASLLGQFRHGKFVVGLRTGIETSFPAPVAHGTRDLIRWGHLRALLVLEIGLRL